jgi:hypothetical protein
MGTSDFQKCCCCADLAHSSSAFSPRNRIKFPAWRSQPPRRHRFAASATMPICTIYIGNDESGGPESSIKLRRMALTTATVRLAVPNFRIAFLM